MKICRRTKPVGQLPEKVFTLLLLPGEGYCHVTGWHCNTGDNSRECIWISCVDRCLAFDATHDGPSILIWFLCLTLRCYLCWTRWKAEDALLLLTSTETSVFRAADSLVVAAGLCFIPGWDTETICLPPCPQQEKLHILKFLFRWTSLTDQLRLLQRVKSRARIAKQHRSNLSYLHWLPKSNFNWHP